MFNNRTLGTIAAMSAYFVWGLISLYWAQLRHVGSLEIIYHRIFWSVWPAWGAVWFFRRRGSLPVIFPSRRVTLITFAAGVLVSFNWWIYIFALNSGRALDASLGYYITPLFNIFLGTVVLRERLSRVQWVAVVLAALGVTVLTLRVGQVPWVSLLIATSFSAYALTKKRLGLGSVHGLALELIPVGAVAGILIGLGVVDGSGHLVGHGLLTTVLLMGAGLVTLVPLALFSYGAARVPLSQVGFLHFITPTMILIFGVLFFGEEFDAARAPGFILVWSALGLYSYSSVRAFSHARRRPPAT